MSANAIHFTTCLLQSPTSGPVHTGRASIFAHKFTCKPVDVACKLCELTTMCCEVLRVLCELGLRKHTNFSMEKSDHFPLTHGTPFDVQILFKKMRLIRWWITACTLCGTRFVHLEGFGFFQQCGVQHGGSEVRKAAAGQSGEFFNESSS